MCLLPDNIISESAGIVIDPQTKGPRINYQYETSVSGIFACGNVLHIHDVVDYVSEEGDDVALSVVNYLNKNNALTNCVTVNKDRHFVYVLPQTIDTTQGVKLKFRVRKPLKDVKILIKSNDEILMTVMKKQLLPAEMEMITLPLHVLQKVKHEITLECVL